MGDSKGGQFSEAIRSLSQHMDELDSIVSSLQDSVIHHDKMRKEAQARVDKCRAQRASISAALEVLRRMENEHESAGQQAPASGECEVVSELGSGNGEGGAK